MLSSLSLLQNSWRRPSNEAVFALFSVGETLRSCGSGIFNDSGEGRLRVNIDAFIFPIVMYRARSIIGTHDTQQIQRGRCTSLGCTNTPLQTTRSPTKGRLAVTHEDAPQPLVDTSRVPSILVPRIQSPAFGHLSAVRRSLRDIGARHPGRAIYHESPTKKRVDNQNSETQGLLSISDLDNSSQRSIVFDREKAESLIRKLLDDRDRRIEEMKDQLFEDVRKEMHCRHAIISNIVHLIDVEKKRTQKLLCRSNVANKLLRKVQTGLTEQSSQLAQLEARINDLESQIREGQAQKSRVQHVIELADSFENTVTSNTEKINQQIGTICEYLQNLQCSLERVMLEQHTVTTDAVDSKATRKPGLSLIHHQLTKSPLLRSPIFGSSKE